MKKRTTQPARKNQPAAMRGQAARKKAGAQEKRSRRALIRNSVLVLAALLMIAVIGGAGWMRGVMEARYKHDLATLVPAEVAFAAEARDLPAHRAIVASFVERLFESPSYDSLLRSEQGLKLFGADESNQPNRPHELLESGLARVKAVSIPVGDALFGPLNIERDLLGSEAIIAVRAELGASVRVVPAVEGMQQLQGAPVPAQAQFPEKRVLLLTRVSSKIKLYLQFDAMVLPGQIGRMLRDAELELRPDGARIIKYTGQGGYATKTVCYALIGDVLALTNGEALLDEVMLLATNPGHSGNSLQEWDGYRDGIFQLAADTATIEAGQTPAEAVEKAAARDIPAAMEALREQRILFTVNAAQCRRMMPFDQLISVSTDLSRVQGGDIYLFVDDTMRAVLSMPSVVAGVGVLALDAEAFAIEARVSVVCDGSRLPANLSELYVSTPGPSAMTGLAPPPCIAVMQLNVETDVLAWHFEAADKARLSGWSELMFKPLESYLRDSVAVFVAPKPEIVDEQRTRVAEGINFNIPPAPTDEMGAVMPRWAVAGRLRTEVLTEDRGLPGGVAESIVRQVIETLMNQSSPTAATLDEKYVFDVESVGPHAVVQVLKRLEDGTTSTAGTGILDNFFGSNSEPACAVIDDVMLLSTSKAMLVEILQAAEAHAQRFEPMGGALHTQLDLATPALAQGVVDVNAMLEGFYTPSNLARLADQAYPSLDTALLPDWTKRAVRQQADREANGDPVESDQLYQQYAQRHLARQRQLRDMYYRAKIEFRTLVSLVHAVGMKMTPSVHHTKAVQRPDAFHVHLVVQLGP